MSTESENSAQNGSAVGDGASVGVDVGVDVGVEDGCTVGVSEAGGGGGVGAGLQPVKSPTAITARTVRAPKGRRPVFGFIGNSASDMATNDRPGLESCVI